MEEKEIKKKKRRRWITVEMEIGKEKLDYLGNGNKKKKGEEGGLLRKRK